MGRFGTAMQIVLAEDNLGDIALVRLALKKAEVDCDLRVFSDGARAIAFLEQIDNNPESEPLDLLLLDMHLPMRDGEEILKCLRSTDHYAQTPVVVMTASDAPRDHAHAQTHGAMHYFHKTSDLAAYMRLGVIVRELLSPVRARGSNATEDESDAEDKA